MSDSVVHKKAKVPASARSKRILQSSVIMNVTGETGGGSDTGTTNPPTGVIQGEGIDIVRENNNYTVSHHDTSDQESLSAGGDFEVVSKVEVDKFGHTTALEKKNLKTKLDANFLSKVGNDTAEGLIKFLKGIDIGNYIAGALGTGGAFKMNDQGQSILEVDKLSVRLQAVFSELLIEKISHIGGQVVITPAEMKCSAVEEMNDVYRCYFSTSNDEVVQLFEAGDQARCQVFAGSTQKYYWRLVVAIGADYIDLSKTDKDGDGIPSQGDHIVQLGNRSNTDRQNAIILSSVGDDAPSFKQFAGVDSFSLSGKDITVISKAGNKLKGVVDIQPGSTGVHNIEGLATGTVNMLRNTGFTGDYESLELFADTVLHPDSPLFSPPLKFWNGMATINEDIYSASGYSVTLAGESLSQHVDRLIPGENYLVSFKAKGETMAVTFSGSEQSSTLTSEYKRYVLKFTATGTSDFEIAGDGTVCEIQLERGTIVSDWGLSPMDNDRTVAKLEAIRYVSDAIKGGSTSILGGLILTAILQLGNYANGEMKNVTAGISGIFNRDSDPAFWAGGTLEQAIRTAANPGILENYANTVITHGGLLISNRAFIRGWITADSGYISGWEIVNNVLRSQYVIVGGLRYYLELSSDRGQVQIKDGDGKVVASFGAHLGIGNRLTASLAYYDQDGNARCLINDAGVQYSSVAVGAIPDSGFDILIRDSLIDMCKYAGGQIVQQFRVKPQSSFLNILMYGLPTSEANAESSGLWKSSGYLRIKD